MIHGAIRSGEDLLVDIYWKLFIRFINQKFIANLSKDNINKVVGHKPDYSW